MIIENPISGFVFVLYLLNELERLSLFMCITSNSFADVSAQWASPVCSENGHLTGDSVVFFHFFTPHFTLTSCTPCLKMGKMSVGIVNKMKPKKFVF